ncbi:DUF1806 family protein [Alkalihalobacterium bogoriense]|uniref:DUF1806 family protein n=1 Tax=Alkalihalobacterium bogoriense TaxID=246272 RepID=UPI00047DC2D9|nr:DUF1806 family protein [Alkalihalobacterium bogoriense]
MNLINLSAVQTWLHSHQDKELYLHLETSNGSYTAYRNGTKASAGAFVRNANICYKVGKITGEGPYRVGLKTELGWVYADGLTHAEFVNDNQLLLAGLDEKGKLAVALQLSEIPFG